METIEVTARFSTEGEVTPRKFTWRGSLCSVESTGRRWQDGEDLHILVMAFAGPMSPRPAEQVYELVFRPSERLWFLASPPAQIGLA